MGAPSHVETMRTGQRNGLHRGGTDAQTNDRGLAEVYWWWEGGQECPVR